MRRTLPPSADIENQIDRLLAVGVGETGWSPVAPLPALVEDDHDE